MAIPGCKLHSSIMRLAFIIFIFFVNPILVFITTIWGETFTFQFASHQSVSPSMAVTGPLEIDVLNKMLPKGCPSSFLHVQEHHHVPTGGAAQIEREVVLHDLLEADHVLRLLEVHVVEAWGEGLLARLLLLPGQQDEDDHGAGERTEQDCYTEIHG